VKDKINSSIPDDKEVILGIRNGTTQTLEVLYRAHFPMILQLVISNNGDEDEAKDIFQESIIVLYNKVKAGDFELNSKLKTYIYAICKRLWLKRLSQQHKFTNNLSFFEDIEESTSDLEEHEHQNRQFQLMQTALSQLGEPCKTIIEEFYLHNKSMQDICEQFGYTNADNAKTQKYKCLQRLKKLFFKA
jgi:RNA polymerase sigma factor (sigma-70 family)